MRPKSSGKSPVVASAAVIALRRAADRLEVLLGLRSRHARFLGGYWAFPGGAVDATDGSVPDDEETAARCAAREFREETGIALDPRALVPAGQRVTPPFFRRRFSTLFFAAEVRACIDPRPEPATGELEALEWIRPAAAIADWQTGGRRIAPPVTVLLRALARLPAGETLHRIAEALARTNVLEEECPRVEFVPGVWLAPLATETLAPATHTNAALVGGRRFVVVDPGSAAAPEISRLLALTGRRVAAGGAASAVVLTHHHGDHVSGALEVARGLGVPIRAHAATVPLLRDPELRSRVVGDLEDGARIDLEGDALRILHTPGHAPGHIVLLSERTRLAIVGDLVSGISSIVIPPDTGDMGAFLASLARVERERPTLLLPGHGPPQPPEALQAAREHRESRERAVLAAVESAPRSVEEIAAEAYRGERVPARFAAVQTLAHLRHLERRGLVLVEAGRWLRRNAV